MPGKKPSDHVERFMRHTGDMSAAEEQKSGREAGETRRSSDRNGVKVRRAREGREREEGGGKRRRVRGGTERQEGSE